MRDQVKLLNSMISQVNGQAKSSNKTIIQTMKKCLARAKDALQMNCPEYFGHIEPLTTHLLKKHISL